MFSPDANPAYSTDQNNGQIKLKTNFQYQKRLLKNTIDYEKVAPTIIKEVLIEGLVKAGMPKE